LQAFFTFALHFESHLLLDLQAFLVALLTLARHFLSHFLGFFLAFLHFADSLDLGSLQALSLFALSLAVFAFCSLSLDWAYDFSCLQVTADLVL
jgi:hypothetical protein